MSEKSPKLKSSAGKRIFRIVLKTILAFLIFFIILVFLVQTAPVQNFIRGKAVSWLEHKLKTKVAVGHIYIAFPKDIVLENIYLEDQRKDTLFSGGKIKIDVSLLKLIKGNIEINDLQLDNITAKVRRQLPDTIYNFQFIIDAFVSKEKSPEPLKKDTANTFTIKGVTLNDVRLAYKDTVTGNDAEATIGHLETRIPKFDLAHQRFDISSFKLSGFTTRVYQSKPLMQAEPASKDIADAKEPTLLGLNIKEVELEKINIDYKNDLSALYTTLSLDKLTLHPEKIDLVKRAVDINDFIVSGMKAEILLGKTEQAKIVEKETKQEVKAQAEAGWAVTVTSLKLDHNRLKFDNDNKVRLNKGMDYAHMDAEDVTIHLDKFYFTTDSVSGNLTEASLLEKSGLKLEQFKTDFAYGPGGASLKNLYLKTPGTELQREAEIHYASAEALKKDSKNAKLDIVLEKSKIQVKDILLFVPSLQKQKALRNAEATLFVNTELHGTINDLTINQLKLAGLSNTNIDIAGTIHGLPDLRLLNTNLDIRSLRSSKTDILEFIPPSSLPSGITVPDIFTLTGTLKGNQQNFTTNLSLSTNLGKATVKATGKDITDKIKSSYEATVRTDNLDLGTILKKKELLGSVTATITVKGRGTDKNTANAKLDGMIQSAVFKQYTYKDLSLNGSIANQVINIKTDITDPNIDFNLTAIADLSGKYPSVKLHTTIDSVNTFALHLTSNAIIYRGKINADFPVATIDSLEGKLEVTNSLLVTDSQRIQLDTVSLTAGHTDTGQFINLYSDALFATIEGRYKLTSLGSVMQQSIQPYFSITPNDSTHKTEPYNFRVTAKVINKPVLKTFLRGLTRLDSITLASHFSNDGGWNANITAPMIDLNDNSIRDLQLHAGTGVDALQVNANVNQVKVGNSIQLFNTRIIAAIKDNKIDFGINIHDRADKNKYNLTGNFQQPSNGTYIFSLKPDSLLLNYDEWTINQNNKIEISDNYVLASNFKLEREGQQLMLNSLSSDKASPLEVSFYNFKLETLTGFIQADSSLVGGILNGKADISDLPESPVFTSDLSITNLNIKKDTAGDLKILVNNKQANTYNADITLSGHGNDVKINGSYYAKQPDNNFDLVLDLTRLPLTTAQAFSNGAIRNASGSVNGKFTIKGTPKAPKVNGNLNFAQAAFVPAKLNSVFKIDNEKLQVDEQGIILNQFSIEDSSGNKLTLNGKAVTTNFTNYNFDFTVLADNFQALNSTKKDNKLFYGKLFFNTNLNIKGTESAPLIDGRLTVNDKTKMTVVLPQKDPGVVDRAGIIEFVDKDAPGNDSLFINTLDTVVQSSYKGMDIAVNVDIKKEAEFTMIIDEGSGDFLNVHGEALLTAGVDPSGKVTVAGSYELEDGGYQLTFNLLKRRFNIQKGSKIVWGGEATQADLNITAVYDVSTSPLDLVKNQLANATDNNRNTYMQKLPFQVFLKIKGKLLQPEISFDVVLPQGKDYNVSPDIVSNVRTKLESLRMDEGELNKQVFALLLLNRFVGENPFNSSTSTSTAMLVKQSVSKLLTEQLNRLAENLVEGVDLNFDVQSSDDYTTGSRQDRTDLNVGLSKRLLNDRLTVTVGSNFELDGPQNSNQQSTNIAGNVALNYRLSKDGRYALRAYRKNEYEGVLDGYVIETGVGFIITIDYNKFRQIFQKKKPKKQSQKPAGQSTTSAAATPPVSVTSNSKPK